MTTNVQLVKKSRNAKTGPIPTTTSARSTCPKACPLAGDGGCYAEAGYYTRMNWDKVDSGEHGTDWDTFIGQIAKLPEGQLWRHNVAGDLQGKHNQIDGIALSELVEANQGKRGFTYTHYPVIGDDINAGMLKEANEGGFTVNASANSVSQAVAIRELTGLPTVTLIAGAEWWQGERSRDYIGHTVVRCPAEYRDNVSCATCKLCSVSTRESIVGFTAHGTRSKAVEIIASDS